MRIYFHISQISFLRSVLGRVSLLVFLVISLNNSSPFLLLQMIEMQKRVLLLKTAALKGCWSQVPVAKGEYSRASFKISADKSKQGRTFGCMVLVTYRTCVFWSVSWCFNSSTFGRLHFVCLQRPQVVWWGEDNITFLHKIYRTNTSDWCRAARQNPTNNIFSSCNTSPSLTL